MDTTISSNFFPRIFDILDKKSMMFQRQFFFLLKLNVLLLILIPTSLFLSPIIASNTNFRAIPIVLILAVFLINLVWPGPKLVNRWQTLRSAAESVKKECVIYSVGCAPYQIENDQKAKNEFISKINKILEVVRQNSENLIPKESDNLYFTESENKIRSSLFEERLDFYKKNRLEDQINWYRKKSTNNNTSDSQYKIWMIIFLLISAFVVIYTSIFQYSQIEAIDIMVAIILGFQSYGNARRFSELSITYNNTLFELEGHKETEDVDDASKFCDFVFKIEDTISREHAVWSVRMGKN